MKRMFRASAHAAMLAGVIGFAATESFAGGEVLPTNFVREQLVSFSGSGEPIGFTWLPDTRILMINRTLGKIYLSAVGSTTPVDIHTVANLNATGFERGLLGIAVDPGWPTRPYVYAVYTHTSGFVYLTRFTASGQLTNPASTAITLATPYHVMTDIPDLTVNHQAGTVRFAPDGKLIMSCGDDNNPCLAQDLTTLNGKLLRLDVSTLPSGGSGPPLKSLITPADNPYSGAANANQRLVYSWGHRNPFRLTVDPATGDVYVGDVGESTQEEVDRVSRTAPGLNYGWPEYEGTSFYNWSTCGDGGTFEAPIYSYNHSGSGNTVIAGPRMRYRSGSFSFPADYDGSVFVVEFYEGWIRRLVPSGANWVIAPPVAGQPTPESWGTGFDFTTDLQMGADGALYFCRMSGGLQRGVHRIRPVSVTASPEVARVNETELRILSNPWLAGRGGIFFVNPATSFSTLHVYDVTGAVVRSWTKLAAGVQTLGWDGSSERGERIPAGVYFVRLNGVAGETAEQKLTILE